MNLIRRLKLGIGSLFLHSVIFIFTLPKVLTSIFPLKTPLRSSWVHVKALQSCPTLWDSMDCSPPGSSIHGILQTGIWEWIAFPSPGDLPKPGIESTSRQSSLMARGYFTTSATQQAPQVFIPHDRTLIPQNYDFKCTGASIIKYSISVPIPQE